MLRNYIAKLFIISHEIENLSPTYDQPEDAAKILELHEQFFNTLGEALSLSEQNIDRLSEEDAKLIRSLRIQHRKIGVALERSSH